jgi:RNA polymerase sigma-70 factor (ECF subfamily)
MNDSDLIRLFRESEYSAFEELVRKYQNKIYNLCCYMLRDRNDAQDATQDVFLKAYRGLRDFRPESSLYTWLYRIALNTCLDYKRKLRREVFRNESLTENLHSNEPYPEKLYESKEIADSIRLALQKLPEKLRAAIVLREIEELTYVEIAQVLHTSVGTVKSRISRAREQLRRFLKKNRD